MSYLYNLIKLYLWGSAKFNIQMVTGDIETLVSAINPKPDNYFRGLRLKSHNPITVEGDFRHTYSQSSFFKLIYSEFPILEIDMYWTKKYTIRATVLLLMFNVLTGFKKISAFNSLQSLLFILLVSFIMFSLPTISIKNRLRKDLRIILKLKG